MRFARRAALLGAGVLVALCAVTVLLKLIFPTARLRNAIQAEVRRHFEREVQLDGVTIHPFGLRMERLRISERPAFTAGRFLFVERAEARWSLAALLRGRVVLKEVTLDSPQVTIVRFPDGRRLNISDLLGRPMQSAPAGSSAPVPDAASAAVAVAPALPGLDSHAPRAWGLGRLLLRHGSLQFNDQSPARQSTSLRDVTLQLHDLRIGRTAGTLTIDRLENALYKARDFEASWQLAGPRSGRPAGWVRLRQGPGSIDNLGAVLASGGSAKTLLMPLMVLQKLDQKAAPWQSLPIDRIDADYRFEKGTVRIARFEADGSVLTMKAEGFLELGTGRLALECAIRAPHGSPFGDFDATLAVSGTLSKPTVRVLSLHKKAVRADLSRFLPQ
jgi:hypothetical protein